MTATSHRTGPPPPPPARPARTRTALRYVAAVVFTLLVAVFAVPDLMFGLDRRSPFVQLVSFRPWVVGGTAVVLLLVAAATLRWRRLWPFAAGLLVVVVAGAALVVPRAVADPAPTGGRPLAVLTFNTFEGRADAGELAALVRAERPDVVAVIEAGSRFAGRLDGLLDGYAVHTADGPLGRDVEGVTALVVDGLGDVEVSTGGPVESFPWLEVTGGGLGDLRVVAFHSLAPIPGSVPQWNADLAGVQRWCGTGGPVVVAGDFNATLDHSALRAGMAGCADAADQRGQGLVPTWGPTDRTRRLGPQIDHVLVSGGIAAEDVSVHDIAGSDHRAVLARLRLPT